MFQSSLKGPFQVGLWFENAGPLVDEHYYPVMGKIYDFAAKNLTTLGHYKKASRASLNAAITVWYVEPEMWA